eukprot:scaffold3268_cov160-Pinguiococcus_pyrenoidosus.AAC.1
MRQTRQASRMSTTGRVSPGPPPSCPAKLYSCRCTSEQGLEALAGPKAMQLHVSYNVARFCEEVWRGHTSVVRLLYNWDSVEAGDARC